MFKVYPVCLLASVAKQANSFESTLFINPKDRLFHDVAHTAIVHFR